MPADPIQFHHRYTRKIETEAIYGEGWLRFAYENPVGRFFVWLLVKRALFSHLYGWQMNKRMSSAKIFPFLMKYNVDVDEFAKSVYTYRSFNEFFYRALKSEARPITPGERVAMFPADGRHLVFPNVDTAEGFYVKGATFSLAELFGEGELPEDQRELARKFAGGAMVISRLCPVDYHRFHFPCDGVVTAPARLINGALFSVSPVALRRSVAYLVQNKRMLTLLESPVFGAVACMEVGATNVGSIALAPLAADGRVKKGELKGFFKFGGSCVITVFQKGRIAFDADVVEQSAACVETYAKMGDRLGEAT